MARLAFLCDGEACQRTEDVVGAATHLMERAKGDGGTAWTYRFVSATTCPTAHEQSVRQARRAASAGRASRAFSPVDRNLAEEMGGLCRTMARLRHGGEYTADSTPSHLLHGIVRALADVAANGEQANATAERSKIRSGRETAQDIDSSPEKRTDVYIFTDVEKLERAEPAHEEQFCKIVEASNLHCYFVNVRKIPADSGIPPKVRDLIGKVGGRLIELPTYTKDRVMFFRMFAPKACARDGSTGSRDFTRINLVVQHASCSVQWLPSRSDPLLPCASDISKAIVAGLLPFPAVPSSLSEGAAFMVCECKGDSLLLSLMLHLCVANSMALLHLKGKDGKGMCYGFLEAQSEQVGIVHLAPSDASPPAGVLPIQIASNVSSMALPCTLNDLLEVPFQRDARRLGQWKSSTQLEGKLKQVLPDLPSAIQQDNNILKEDRDLGVSSALHHEQGPRVQISKGPSKQRTAAKAEPSRRNGESERDSKGAVKREALSTEEPREPKRLRLPLASEISGHGSAEEVIAWVKTSIQNVVDNLSEEIQSVETTGDWVSKSMKIAESAEHIVSVAVHSGRELGEIESGNSPGQARTVSSISACIPEKLADLDSYLKGKERGTNLKIAWTLFQVFVRFELSTMPSVQDPIPKSTRKQVVSLLSSVVFELPNMEEGLKELCDHVLIPRYGLILPTTLDILYDRLGFADAEEEEESWAVPAELPVHSARRAYPAPNQHATEEFGRAAAKPDVPVKERGQFSRGRANLQRTAIVKVRRKAVEAELKVRRPPVVTRKPHVQAPRKPSFPTMCGTPRTEYADCLPPPAPKLVRNGRLAKSVLQSPGVGCSQPSVLETPLHARPRALEFVLEPTPCRMDPLRGPRIHEGPPFVCQRVLFGSP